jgi:hypothetical protein
MLLFSHPPPREDCYLSTDFVCVRLLEMITEFCIIAMFVIIDL